jgi:nicotinate-nucleotide--dimethylbenzimidazole phosphoribosyltransferase
MGIGNTTPCSAICTVLTGRPPAQVTGRGTGLTDAQLVHKIAVVQRAVEVNAPDPSRPLEVLSKLGGLEIAGIAGVILGAAARRIPSVVDGFISGTAALVAVKLAPRCRDYLIPAHVSTEPGHRAILEHLRLEPLLELDMRLGEGTGAALGIFLAETSVRLLNEMATFPEAGVSQRQDS